MKIPSILSTPVFQKVIFHKVRTKLHNKIKLHSMVTVLGQLTPRKIAPPNLKANPNPNPNPNPNWGQFSLGAMIWIPMITHILMS